MTAAAALEARRAGRGLRGGPPPPEPQRTPLSSRPRVYVLPGKTEAIARCGPLLRRTATLSRAELKDEGGTVRWDNPY